MTRPAPARVADIVRIGRAAQKLGKRVVGVTRDGTVLFGEPGEKHPAEAELSPLSTPPKGDKIRRPML